MIKIVAHIQGHPWDLWGLAKIFDGENPQALKVVAAEPVGTPRYDFNKPGERERFRLTGYDRLAHLTAAVLERASVAECDLTTVSKQAADLVSSINGIAKLLDPGYFGVRLISVAYKAPGGEGQKILSSTTPNKGRTSLGRLDQHAIIGLAAVELARSDPAVKFVLDVYNMPISWVSLYLIYDCIAGSLGGTKDLENSGWLSKPKIKEFAKAANLARDLRVGIRHGSKPDEEPAGTLISIEEGHDTIMRLTYSWLAKRIEDGAVEQS